MLLYVSPSMLDELFRSQTNEVACCACQRDEGDQVRYPRRRRHRKGIVVLMVGKGAGVRLGYTCIVTRKSLVIDLQLTRALEQSVPRTQHCSKSKTVLPKHSMSNRGETVLSEGSG